MTTYTLHRTDTDTELPAYQIRDEAARLDGAASNGWTPGPDSIPAHPERMRKPRREHHDVPAYDYARLIGQSGIPRDRAAIRDVRAHMRVGYEHLRQEAQDWWDLEFSAATVKHLPPVRVSADYLAKRDLLERMYERDRDALIRGLPAAAPLPEQHPARELAPQRLDADAARRRKALAQAAHGERREPATPVATEQPTYNEMAPELERQPTGWKRATWLTRAFDAVFPLKPREPRKDGGA